ncbi:MAG: hypothetical protein ABJQ96_04210, partial [Crocinitomicaceae bacterium]
MKIINVRYSLRVTIGIVLISFAYSGSSQCPSASFTVGTTYCLDELIELTNTSVNGDVFDFDYCGGDYGRSSTGELKTTLSG